MQSGEVRLQVRHPEKENTPSVRSYTSLLVLPSASSHKGISRSNNNYNANIKKETKSLDVSALPQCADTNCILTRPEDCMALIGGNVKLSVSFVAIPGTKVVWYKACHPIVEGRNVTINTTDNQSTLHITNISADDSGKYTVEVMNDLNIEAAVVSVAVEGPPEAPSGKPSISLGPDRVAVAWCGPPYDGGCALTGFIIEMQQLANNTKPSQNDFDDSWQELTRVVDSLAYTVKNLQPQTLYRFRVRAENVHGRSAPSQPSEFVQMSTRESASEDFNQTINVQPGGDFKTRFDIIEELGKGRFGIVYKVQEKSEARQVLAAKVIKCIKSRDRQKVLEEISIMRALKHPKLLQLAASFESPSEIVMVMEYITGGELFERVVADDFTLTEKDCILFLRQVCEGVAYMHSQSVVHLDLKPENIMCHTRTSHQIKIIDFGLAQRLDTNAPVRVLFGTPEFIPPEIIGYEPICFKSDMWSVGVICYVLLSGLSPFMGDSDVETFTNITRADYDFDDEAFDCVSQEAKDLISNLLVHRKEDRWTAKQCLESKWLSQGSDENLSNNKICTDKLKKFIIRRKWQKTGNAIRALGRMATLSASRRNSAISMGVSLPSSPRPSISGIPIFHTNISAQMSSLHEEEDDFSIEMPIVEQHKRMQRTFKMRDKSQCSERSDSGYSECSNCSATGGANGICHCAREFDKQQVVADTNATVPMLPSAQETLLSVAVPHNLLKSKLEEIANKTKSHNDEAKMEIITTETRFDGNQNGLSALTPTVGKGDNVGVVEELKTNTESVVQSSTKTEPIMASDFTNTIKMRKKSLENSVTREKGKQHPKPICEATGKVSLLKDKFNQPNVLSKSTLMTAHASKPKLSCADKPTGTSFATNRSNKVSSYGCLVTGLNKSLGSASTTSRVAAVSTAVDKPTQTRSMPNSPIPLRAITPSRLSNRVREATERLAQQQTISTTARRNESRSRLPLAGKINRSSSETKHIMS